MFGSSESQHGIGNSQYSRKCATIPFHCCHAMLSATLWPQPVAKEKCHTPSSNCDNRNLINSSASPFAGHNLVAAGGGNGVVTDRTSVGQCFVGSQRAVTDIYCIIIILLYAVLLLLLLPSPSLLLIHPLLPLLLAMPYEVFLSPSTPSPSPPLGQDKEREGQREAAKLTISKFAADGNLT